MNIQSEKPQYEPKKMDPVSTSRKATSNPQPCQPKIMDPVSKSHNAASNPPPFEHKKMDPVPKSGNATSNPPPREIQEIDPVSKSCNATSNPPTSEPKNTIPLSKSGDAASYPPPCEHKKMDPVPKSGNATSSPGPREPQEIDPLSKTSNATSNPPPPREPKKIDPVYKTSNATSNPPAPEPKKMDLVPKSSKATSNPSYGSENIDPVAKSSIYSVDPGTKSSISSTSNPPCGPKGIDSIAKSNTYSTSNPCPRMLTNSETIAATTATTAMPNDAKGSDSITNYSRGSGNSTLCDSLESSNAPLKPHTGGDGRWEAIHLANFRESPLGLPHFRLLKRLGYGDIGSVYLVELRGTNTYFAMKVMDKALLLSRNKLLRSQTEREILGLLDHPFLPTLYSHFETDKFYCLVMEFCSGGNLHSLRQKQPNKYFSEHAARFYASEVLLALEYLHMLGIVYRDLKPENVLVRDEGHIMLSDFDLSLRCSVNPTIVKSSLVHVSNGGGILEDEFAQPGYVQPTGFFPRILPKRSRKSKSDFGLLAGGSLPELMAEPTNARSMSFVGTHEYLAPEIIRGKGHGSAVDWWTFGIFLYELLHGTTPFKGSGNRATLHNVVGQPLRFPDAPSVSHVARDLIRGLLVKEPKNRIAYKRGATEIKQHPFFDGVNWALVRSAMPPHIPEPVDFGQFASKEAAHTEKKVAEDGGIDSGGGVGNKNDNIDSSYIDFEYF